MEKKVSIGFDGVDIDLYNITFKNMPKIPENYNDNLNVKGEDKYEIKDINKDGFSVEVSRRVYLEPNYVFDIFVSFIVSFEFDVDTKKIYDDNFIDIKKKIEENVIVLLDKTTVLSRVSALISSITTHVGLNPIVTAPNFDIKK